MNNLLHATYVPSRMMRNKFLAILKRDLRYNLKWWLLYIGADACVVVLVALARHQTHLVANWPHNCMLASMLVAALTVRYSFGLGFQLGVSRETMTRVLWALLPIAAIVCSTLMVAFQVLVTYGLRIETVFVNVDFPQFMTAGGWGTSWWYLVALMMFSGAIGEWVGVIGAGYLPKRPGVAMLLVMFVVLLLIGGWWSMFIGMFNAGVPELKAFITTHAGVWIGAELIGACLMGLAVKAAYQGVSTQE